MKAATLAARWRRQVASFGRCRCCASTESDDVFWVLAGDVFAPDFEFSQNAVDKFKASGKLAHIWLVPNPEHNLKGDFGLQADGVVVNELSEKYTFSTIALYRKSLFSLPYCDIPAGKS